MTPEHYQRIKRIFQAALERETVEPIVALEVMDRHRLDRGERLPSQPALTLERLGRGLPEPGVQLFQPRGSPCDVEALE